MFQVGFIFLNSPLALVLRNLYERWVRTVLTALGITVGVATMVAVNATNTSTLSAINRFFDEASGRSDLLIESVVSGESFSAALLNNVSRFPGVVAAAAGITGVTIPLDDVGSWDEQYAVGGTAVPGTNFWLLGRDPAIDGQIHDYRLVSGRLLQPDETDYSLILVDEYAEKRDIEVGEEFVILTPGNAPAQLRVVGLIAKEGIGVTNEGAIGIAPLPVVQSLFNLSGQVNQIELVVDDSVASNAVALDKLRRDIQAHLGSDFDVKPPASRGEMVTNSLQSYQQGLNFFSVVSLFVGSFLIYNAFAMTVVERTREIGMFRAIGMTRRQIIGMVLAEAGILGLLGSLAGVGFGLLLARSLVISVSGLTGQSIEQIVAAPHSLVGSVIIGVLVTVVAAAIPALQASRISPLQALRIQGSVDERRWLSTGLRLGPLTVTASLLVLYYVPFRAEVAFYIGSNSIFVLLLGATLCIPIFTSLTERLIRPLVILIFGSEGRLGSGNINRARGRTTLTVAALMVGISMVVGISGMTSSFESDIQEWINTALGGDLFVQSPLTMSTDIESRLMALDEVSAVTRSRFVTTRLVLPPDKDEVAIFIAVDPHTYLAVRGLRVQVGPEPVEIMQQLAEGGAIVVGADVANKHNLALNDTVILKTKRGEQPFRIAAIVIDFTGGETTTVTGSWGDLRRYFGVNDVSTFAVRLQSGASLEAVTDRIENELGQGKNLSVESKQEFEQKMRQLSAQAFSLFDVLGLIGLVVAALGVVNTMLMNVLERTRELGGLRSLGMTRRQVYRMILAEAVAIGLMGAVFGVCFGVVLSDVFIIGLRAIGGFVLTPKVPYLAMGYSFIIAFVVAIGAALYPAYHASRITIITAIKHE